MPPAQSIVNINEVEFAEQRQENEGFCKPLDYSCRVEARKHEVKDGIHEKIDEILDNLGPEKSEFVVEQDFEVDADEEYFEDDFFSRGFEGPNIETCDRVKALEEARLESERDLCIFNGALDYLSSQLMNVNADHCPVCFRLYETNQGCQNTRDQLEQKIEETKQTRDKLSLVEIHETCVKTLAETREEEQYDKSYQSRVTFNTRLGALTELRNQKIECLMAKRCFACLGSFNNTESSLFLSKIDRKASLMEKELHIHT